LLAIVNKVRLLGTIITGSRIVEKIIATMPKRYEASITTLENTKYMSEITSEELLTAMQAQELSHVSDVAAIVHPRMCGGI
jgi:hypothetical protein